MTKMLKFRGLWFSYLIKDLPIYQNKEDTIKSLMQVLDLMTELKLNCLIFHLRANNDAYYDTNLAPKAPGFVCDWDYLSWLIAECHKRGIEFHAWLNPYRIASNNYPLDVTPAFIGNNYKDYPLNPASKKENILITYPEKKSCGAILNPCRQDVIDHVVFVIRELCLKYDIDAVHFDDYFYAPIGRTNDISEDADQKDFLKYLSEDANDVKRAKGDFRRENVNRLIEAVNAEIKRINLERQRQIKFGISPTAIYKNGDGKVRYQNNRAITSGSLTSGHPHYDYYLYSDSKHWLDAGLVDYLIPQTYFPIRHQKAGFCVLADWWNKVARYLPAELYLGIGIYQFHDKTKTGWDEDELEKEISFICKRKNIKGISFFCFKSIFKLKEEPNSRLYQALTTITKYYR